MSLYGSFVRRGPSGFGYNSTAEQVTDGLDLSGRTYVVTGCNSGLGAETGRVLSLRGARVIGCARTKDKALAAGAGWPGELIAVACDLSEPASVQQAVRTIVSTGHEVDGIIANAGIMAIPTREVKHGIELQMLTNHVGHFMFVTGLMDQLTEDGRVVMLSSSAHQHPYPEGIRFDDWAAEQGYTSWLAYGQSKLANHLFAVELTKRLGPHQVANSVHPGIIATNLLRHQNGVLQSIVQTVTPLALKTIPQGAATQVYVAVHPDTATVEGRYFANCQIRTPTLHARDEAMAARL
ncbi:MAG: SDR family NAD(P)-dependent oxidoreductase, partial [Myxococcota bacterium]